jgi:hypothetical protein
VVDVDVFLYLEVLGEGHDELDESHMLRISDVLHRLRSDGTYLLYVNRVLMFWL